MKHLIITRFNITLNRWKNPEDSPSLKKEWLDHRFELFEKFCLPSVLNQSNKNFNWLILFDKQTPKEYRLKVNLLLNAHAFIIPKYVDGIGEMKAGVFEVLNNILTDKDKHILTTRIDNDDAVHQGFVAEIQSLAAGQEKEMVIDLEKGYQLISQQSEHELRKLRTGFNHFISLLEPIDDINTVYFKFHKQWAEHGNVISNHKKRLWMQIVHGKNIANKESSKSFATNSTPFSEFGFSLETKKTPFLNRVVQNTKASLKLLLKKNKP